jgi:hypothetical protein
MSLFLYFHSDVLSFNLCKKSNATNTLLLQISNLILDLLKHFS